MRLPSVGSGTPELLGSEMPSRPSRRRILLLIFDVLMSPAALAAGAILRLVRRIGLRRLPVAHAALRAIGVLPIRNHYYEPYVSTLKRSPAEERDLPGIDFRIDAQLSLLAEFRYIDELLAFPIEQKRPDEFFYHNRFFESGDAEALYSMVRHFKPKTVIEVGAGYSSLLISAATRQNRVACHHVCVEPFPRPWLASIGAELLRQPVETLDPGFVDVLGEGDMLFIDSSHVIRPQGDVLFLYQRVLPRLKSGVLVHVHDVFTPRDYLGEWILQDRRLWNEQYLLEGVLADNDRYEVVLALNMLSHHARNSLAAAFPVYRSEAKSREPGSFWIRRLGNNNKAE